MRFDGIDCIGDLKIDGTTITATASEINTACDQSINAFHASGRKIYIYENTAPTGWTIVAVTDRVLAVKGGSQAYNTTGGTQAGTWTQPDHTLSIAEMPSHRHKPDDNRKFMTGVNLGGGLDVDSGGQGDATWYTNYQGGGGAHNHGTTYRPYAAVGIIVSRD
jgi:hypothetical protein